MARAACLLLALTIVAAAPRQQRPAFRSSVQTVAVHATVKDGTGRLVPDLTREKFQILDNGKPVEISTFSSDVQPLTVALLLDMSGSMNRHVLLVRDAALHFIDALLPHDRVRVGTFGAEISISPLLTGNKTLLTRIVREELWPGGGTPLWNAMYAGMESLEKETGRRVVLVLTDGVNAESLPGWRGDFNDVRKRATAGGFMLYAIGTGGTGEEDARQKFDALIDDTGGGHFRVGKDDDLKSTFTRVAEELRRQYLIGFTPATVDGREHKLDVRVTEPGLTVRARKSYVAVGR